MNFEKNLEVMGYKFSTMKNKRVFESAVITGNLIFVSGHAAKVDGELKYKGIVGNSVSLKEAQEAAKICFINCLAAVRDQIGSLDKIKRIVNIKGYVASTPEFIDQPEVMNELSILINEVFGEVGKHSRVSLGVSSLPEGTPVEVELIVEI